MEGDALRGALDQELARFGEHAIDASMTLIELDESAEPTTAVAERAVSATALPSDRIWISTGVGPLAAPAMARATAGVILVISPFVVEEIIQSGASSAWSASRRVSSRAPAAGVRLRANDSAGVRSRSCTPHCSGRPPLGKLVVTC
jgi:hypothetical protein